MRGIGANFGGSRQQGGFMTKYTPPSDPLEHEKKNKWMAPPAGWQIKKKEEALVKTMEAEIRENAASPDIQAAIYNAYQLKLMMMREEAIDAEVDKSYVQEFNAWLLGKSALNTPANNTPWGNQRLVGPSINRYLHSFVDKKIEFQRKLAILGTFIPQEIGEAWLYFKYIVGQKDPIDEAYLNDFNWWANPYYFDNPGKNLDHIDPISGIPYSEPARKPMNAPPENPMTAGNPGTNAIAGSGAIIDSGVPEPADEPDNEDDPIVVPDTPTREESEDVLHDVDDAESQIDTEEGGTEKDEEEEEEDPEIESKLNNLESELEKELNKLRKPYREIIDRVKEGKTLDSDISEKSRIEAEMSDIKSAYGRDLAELYNDTNYAKIPTIIQEQGQYGATKKQFDNSMETYNNLRIEKEDDINSSGGSQSQPESPRIPPSQAHPGSFDFEYPTPPSQQSSQSDTQPFSQKQSPSPSPSSPSPNPSPPKLGKGKEEKEENKIRLSLESHMIKLDTQKMKDLEKMEKMEGGLDDYNKNQLDQLRIKLGHLKADEKELNKQNKVLFLTGGGGGPGKKKYGGLPLTDTQSNRQPEGETKKTKMDTEEMEQDPIEAALINQSKWAKADREVHKLVKKASFTNGDLKLPAGKKTEEEKEMYNSLLATYVDHYNIALDLGELRATNYLRTKDPEFLKQTLANFPTRLQSLDYFKEAEQTHFINKLKEGEFKDVEEETVLGTQKEILAELKKLNEQRSSKPEDLSKKGLKAMRKDVSKIRKLMIEKREKEEKIEKEEVDSLIQKEKEYLESHTKAAFIKGYVKSALGAGSKLGVIALTAAANAAAPIAIKAVSDYMMPIQTSYYEYFLNALTTAGGVITNAAALKKLYDTLPGFANSIKYLAGTGLYLGQLAASGAAQIPNPAGLLDPSKYIGIAAYLLPKFIKSRSQRLSNVRF